MKKDVERNMGIQPIAEILTTENLKPSDLVSASSEHITHKMVNRACKGRRLTPNVKQKIYNALNIAADNTYKQADLFNY